MMKNIFAKLSILLSWPRWNENPITVEEAKDLNFTQITNCTDYPEVGNVWVKHPEFYALGIVFNNFGQFGGVVVIVPQTIAPLGILNSFVYEPLGYHGMVALTRPPGQSCNLLEPSDEPIGEGIFNFFFVVVTLKKKITLI